MATDPERLPDGQPQNAVKPPDSWYEAAVDGAGSLSIGEPLGSLLDRVVLALWRVANRAESNPRLPNGWTLCAAGGRRVTPSIDATQAAIRKGEELGAHRFALYFDEVVQMLQAAYEVDMGLCAGCPVRGAARDIALEVTLCQFSRLEAVDGACPEHGGDSCLRQFAPVGVDRCVQSWGRPDTAEGEPTIVLTEYQNEFRGFTATTRTTPEAQAVIRAALDFWEYQRRLRAALRVGGAQPDREGLEQWAAIDAAERMDARGGAQNQEDSE